MRPLHDVVGVVQPVGAWPAVHAHGGARGGVPQNHRRRDVPQRDEGGGVCEAHVDDALAVAAGLALRQDQQVQLHEGLHGGAEHVARDKHAPPARRAPEPVHVPEQGGDAEDGVHEQPHARHRLDHTRVAPLLAVRAHGQGPEHAEHGGKGGAHVDELARVGVARVARPCRGGGRVGDEGGHHVPREQAIGHRQGHDHRQLGPRRGERRVHVVHHAPHLAKHAAVLTPLSLQRPA
eukprot:CAMPEP_0197580456 /NCGR_PEP_ID=MMETSP1326-20131121/4250_1 /TAXON_ID=1155430 /ORGANISM="Genus nov. species nov., Strain RCC2288" /LENGTH=234 /DNA_ID=CAMNT_0043144209 /DNA_START=377 /DNA_END=1078 /DNA_ORIENTATION=+